MRRFKVDGVTNAAQLLRRDGGACFELLADYLAKLYEAQASTRDAVFRRARELDAQRGPYQRDCRQAAIVRAPV
jgi:hypothetical protein